MKKFIKRLQSQLKLSLKAIKDKYLSGNIKEQHDMKTALIAMFVLIFSGINYIPLGIVLGILLAIIVWGLTLLGVDIGLFWATVGIYYLLCLGGVKLLRKKGFRLD